MTAGDQELCARMLDTSIAVSRVLTVARRSAAAYPTDYASGNRAEQNPLHWWKAIVDTTQALLQLVSPNDIAGVALSGQMMGCLCVDKNGHPLRPHMLYCDQRSQKEGFSSPLYS